VSPAQRFVERNRDIGVEWATQTSTGFLDELDLPRGKRATRTLRLHFGP
jgi:hypothetical protein